MAWRSDFHFDFFEKHQRASCSAAHNQACTAREDRVRFSDDTFATDSPLRGVGDSSGIFAKPLEKTRVFFLAIRTDQGNGKIKDCDWRAFACTCEYLMWLALSPPSLMMMSAFFSKCPYCK